VTDGPLVRQIDLATAEVTTLVGRVDCQSSIDGDFATAAFNSGAGLVYLPSTRNLYPVDESENVIREIR
jgi:hypothetical protein